LREKRNSEKNNSNTIQHSLSSPPLNFKYENNQKIIHSNFYQSKRNCHRKAEK
jgi:hypothetical protein